MTNLTMCDEVCDKFADILRIPPGTTNYFGGKEDIYHFGDMITAKNDEENVWYLRLGNHDWITDEAKYDYIRFRTHEEALNYAVENYEDIVHRVYAA